MNDLTFRVALIIRILKDLRTGQFDIETAFLYSDLLEDIYMKIPEGYAKCMLEKHNQVISADTHLIKLNKAIYGLVQAARQWWKKFKEAMELCDYYPCKEDP